eukprot:TRINITY_DN4702_c0_g2_i1.p2 TRINITY_DN4702_c0_g2~~TRINITY_DN4702_c0_g2_i1.p2  ORF type:complete len:129 (-),score=38.68 TRINITY_DN4702_c0_g2_i1:632-1018(-)
MVNDRVCLSKKVANEDSRSEKPVREFAKVETDHLATQILTKLMDVKKEFESTSKKFELNSESEKHKESVLNSSSEEDDFVLNTKRLRNFSLRSSKREAVKGGRKECAKLGEDELKKEIMKNSYNLRKY